MANVDSEKPMLRGLTPPVLPQLAQREEPHKAPPEATPETASSQVNEVEAFPGELTPVVTVDQSMSLAAANEPPSAFVPEPPRPEAHEDLAVLAPDQDRTVICPTPIPPEADDQTHPTVDAQILDATPNNNPAVPARAVSLGMGNIVAKHTAPSLKDRLVALARKPVSLSGLQFIGVIAVAAVAGGLITAATSSGPSQAQPPRVSDVAAAPPVAKPSAPTAPPKPLAPAVAEAAAAPTPAAEAANKPVARKKKPLKKFAKAARTGAPPKATR